MGVSYNKLWKILIDRNMTKTELRLKAGISTMALAKLGKNEDVSMGVLKKICSVLSCDFGDIMELSHPCLNDSESSEDRRNDQ